LNRIDAAFLHKFWTPENFRLNKPSIDTARGPHLASSAPCSDAHSGSPRNARSFRSDSRRPWATDASRKTGLQRTWHVPTFL